MPLHLTEIQEGTGPDSVVRLDSNGMLPAVNASQLTDLPAVVGATGPTGPMGPTGVGERGTQGSQGSAGVDGPTLQQLMKITLGT